jgi:hypothetical protein
MVGAMLAEAIPKAIIFWMEQGVVYGAEKLDI